MISLKIKDDDIVLDELVEGQDEEKQCVERILTTCTTEWFLNTNFGLNYPAIKGKNVSDEDIRVAITNALIQESRVSEIQDILIHRDRSQRTVDIRIQIKMKSGALVEVVR